MKGLELEQEEEESLKEEVDQNVQQEQGDQEQEEKQEEKVEVAQEQKDGKVLTCLLTKRWASSLYRWSLYINIISIDP